MSKKERVMCLFAKINGDPEYISMDTTESEWGEMKDSERSQLVQEWQENVVNIWCEPRFENEDGSPKDD